MLLVFEASCMASPTIFESSNILFIASIPHYRCIPQDRMNVGLKNLNHEVRVLAECCIQEGVCYATGLCCCGPGLYLKPEIVVNDNSKIVVDAPCLTLLDPMADTLITQSDRDYHHLLTKHKTKSENMQKCINTHVVTQFPGIHALKSHNIDMAYSEHSPQPCGHLQVSCHSQHLAFIVSHIVRCHNTLDILSSR